MSSIIVKKNNKTISGKINLERSKSIANRVLIIQALCKEPFEIFNLSGSDDTNTLKQLIKDDAATMDVGAAGTTMRFLTAYNASREGREVVMTGSERMKNRPISVLTDALRTLGADINFLEKDGYPPFRILGNTLDGGKLKISSAVSSQYITALLLIAPTLKNGLELTLVGELVSRPYIQMTLSIMEYFDINYSWEGDTITILNQEYIAKDFNVEADWSAASYWYSMVAMSDSGELELVGLNKDSLQGDNAIVRLYEYFGVYSEFKEDSVVLKKKLKIEPLKEIDFVTFPDVAQTLAVSYAAANASCTFNGLQTLKIKETDRAEALSKELAKCGVHFYTKSIDTSIIEKSEKMNSASIDTYDDHRMAMSFAPLAINLGEITINDSEVVSKSYPNYWKDLESVGFEIIQK